MSAGFIARTTMVALTLTAGLFATPVAADHPNALWRVVHGLCLRDSRFTGTPAPCLSVDRRSGYAVVPDLQRPTQVLLVPTRRIKGIESPEILRPGAVNYWQAAWDARRWVERRAGRAVSRDRIGLAINSISSRSQNQLHIHVDCLTPEVRRELTGHQREIGRMWTTLRVGLAGRRYRARRLDGAELGERNPFLLLARGDAQARAHMGRETLVVAGATFADGSPGFFLLANGQDHAFGESLLDHRCAVLREP